MTDKTKAEKAMDVAKQIAGAVVKKFPGYKDYLRRYDMGDEDDGFIEIVLKPERGQDIAVAYSDTYFLTATKENINEKAKRILSDLRIHAGIAP